MSILFVTSYYYPFIESLNRKYNNFKGSSYKEAMEMVLNQFFADTGASYIYALKHHIKAHIVIQNAEFIQKKWAEENSVHYTENNWMEEILIAQTKQIKPDFFYTDVIDSHSEQLLKAVSNYARFSVAWISFPFKKLPNLETISLVLTSTYDYKKQFNQMGIKSEYMLPAFNKDVLNHLKDNGKCIPFSFVGGINDVHKNRWEALNFLCDNTDISIFGYGVPPPPAGIKNRLFGKDKFKKIRSKHKGEAWGLEMYQYLKDSLMTFNIHEDLLKGDVGNMRMFEATGVGTLLLNDDGNNLSTLFEVDKEIVVYKSFAEALEKVKYYIQNPSKAIEIGVNAQKRTLRDYNYDNYIMQLTDYFKILRN